MLANTIKTRGFHVGVRFAPPAALDRHHKQDFQVKASAGFDWARHEYNDKLWTLSSPQSEGDPRSHLKLSVHPDGAHFEDFFPVSPFDVFLDNFRLAMKTVAEVFSPKVALGSEAIIRLTAGVEGNDARVFLGSKCLSLDRRLAPLGRPVHAVGIKMFLPPVPTKGEPPWQAEVKIESLIEDVRQVFIEVDAKWGTPMVWDVEELARRIGVANDFSRNQVVSFLTQYESDGPPA